MAESGSTYQQGMSAVGTISPDGAWRWDGSSWQPLRAAVEYESARILMRRLVLSFQLFIGIAAVVALGLLLQLLAPANFVAGSSARDSAVRMASDFLAGIGFLAEALAFVVTVVLFLIWFHRVYRNLPALGVARPHSMWRPVLVWFIPIANIFLAPRTVQEAWDGSHGRPVQHPTGLSTRLDPPVRFWWTAFLAANILGRFAPNPRSVTPGDVMAGALWQLAFEALLLVSAVLAIRMVRLLQTAQDSRAVSYGWVATPAAPPDRRCGTCHQVVAPDDTSCQSCLSPL
jgi:hypothetical protein